MRISGRKSPWADPRFPGMDDLPLSSYRMGAQVVGDLFEELSVSLFCGEAVRLKTDSTADTCPDLQQNRSEFFVESKVAGKHRDMTFYVQCMEDYVQMLETFFPLNPEIDDTDPAMLYALWKYSAHQLEQYETVTAVREAVVASIEAVTIVDQSVMDAVYEWKQRHDKVRNYESVGRATFFKLRHRESDVSKPKEFVARFSLNGDHHWLSYVVSHLRAYDLCSGTFPLYVLAEHATLEKASLKRVLEHWSSPTVQLV